MKRFIAKVSKSFKGGEKGFTLIELLIVIVILGVLAAAIIPNLSKFVGRGNVGAANAELASVRTAVAAYESDNEGSYPCTAQPAVTDITYALAQGIDLTLLTQYVSASGFKGTYRMDYNGIIYCVTDGYSVSGVNASSDNLKWQ